MTKITKTVIIFVKTETWQFFFFFSFSGIFLNAAETQQNSSLKLSQIQQAQPNLSTV